MAAVDIRDWREKEFLSTKQVATVLGIGLTAAYNLVYSLPHVRINKGSLRIRTVYIEKFIKEQERGR